MNLRPIWRDKPSTRCVNSVPIKNAVIIQGCGEF